jgi:hypothetical protein
MTWSSAFGGAPQPAHRHGVMLSIQYRSTASSAQKSTPTFTAGGSHMNRSRNSISGPISFSRVKTISKNPLEFATQRDASTDTTAVHLRSRVGGCMSENWTSLNAKVGLHTCWPTACVTLMSPIMPARNPDKHDRYICWRPSSSNLVRAATGRGTAGVVATDGKNAGG